MNILVVDDEQLARQRLIMLVNELGDPYRVAAEASNGEAALNIAADQAIDVILMDIQMPGMNGLDAARTLAGLPLPPAVIFTTAFEEHALPAFESNAVDYLLKPIRQEKLLQALEKVSVLTRPQIAATEKEESTASICAQIRGEIERIPLHDVYFLQADHKYVMVRHEHGEALVEDSLVSLEQRYPTQFLRIHRSILVTASKLSGLGKNDQGQVVVTLRGLEETLPVSRRHLPEVRRWLKR